MALSVIGAGWGRTGTYSLKAALEELGLGPCHHMKELIEDPARAVPWARAARGEAVDWDAVFAGFVSAVDWPSCDYYRELAAHFPEAKVVLTVRDADAWFKSTQQTIFSELNTFFREASPLGETMRALGGGHIRGRFNDRDVCVAGFEKHAAEVQSTIPRSRLLVFEVSEGWGPLCRFLGVPVPAVPFPLTNTTASWRERRAHRDGQGG